jgi:hypothetical protein
VGGSRFLYFLASDHPDIRGSRRGHRRLYETGLLQDYYIVSKQLEEPKQQGCPRHATLDCNEEFDFILFLVRALEEYAAVTPALGCDLQRASLCNKLERDALCASQLASG